MALEYTKVVDPEYVHPAVADYTSGELFEVLASGWILAEANMAHVLSLAKLIIDYA